ncbi:MAG: hypothetical protein ACI9FB_004160 [Candidatus Azotimanducaceae bacterium]|jgi:uncharacterized protein
MLTGSLPEQVNYRKSANENRKFVGPIPLSKFLRLSGSLESEEGTVEVNIEFRRGRKQKTLIVGTASAKVRLLCQRCLSEMSYNLAASIRHIVVNSEEALLESPQDEDNILCLEDRISLVDIFEDEMIIELPMVPKHELSDGEGIEGSCRVEHENDATPIKSDTHRPFAGLSDLKNDFNRS